MSKHTLFQRTSLFYSLLFVGFLISFLKCESLEDPFVQKKESSEARKIETVSLEEAKNFFLSNHSKNEKKTNQHINYAVEEPNHSLKLTPDWTTLQHNELFEINHAKLTSAVVEVNRAGLFESQLIFIKVNNEIKNAIYTIYRDKVSDDGKLIRGRVYLNQTDGLFLDGFKIENGLFSKRFVVKSIGVQKASLMELLIQTVTTDDDCWNTDMLEGMEGGVELEEVEVVGTTGGDYGNSDNTGVVYSIIRGWNNNYLENNHRSIGGGGYGGVMGSVYANNVETEDTEDEEEVCKDGKIKDANGNCVCPKGKIENKTTKLCECPKGYKEDHNGKCVKIPCKGDPVPNPEIAPQKGPSGILGGMYGCTRFGGGCVGQDGRDKFHGGIDLKANYGDPIYAMHDGTASLAQQGDGSRGAGYYVVLTSTVEGDTVKTLYFHMQKDNRVSGNVKAGDIIGYQGDSGNLKGAIEDGYAVSHLHIKVKENGTTVDPEQYMETSFNDTTGVATHSSDCN